jgi:hypothetical protein
MVKRILTFKTDMTDTASGKSQFEVCGAQIMTDFPWTSSGIDLLIFQPLKNKNILPSIYFMDGVSKM